MELTEEDGVISDDDTPIRRHSSLKLRRQPVDELLQPDDDDCAWTDSAAQNLGNDNNNNENAGDNDNNNDGVGLLRGTCLSAKYPLRTQMMIIFGSINALSIFVVLAVCIFGYIFFGETLVRLTYEEFDEMAKEAQSTTARYLAETLSPKLIPEDLTQIISETVQDRFMGYPSAPGYEEDELVPFFDTESQTNKYPIVGEPIPFTWEIEPNVNDDNYMEHVQNRWLWYNQSNLEISTATGWFAMQGMCDPSVTDPTHPSFYPNCTEENNNVARGGIVAPSLHGYQIHRKVSDLNPLFKALYEYHQDLYSLGLYFANGGSGFSFQYPYIGSTNGEDLSYYESIGCDWLLETPHPFNDSRTIISDITTQKRIRKGHICRPNATVVPTYHYNPLERGWCRDQAINPHKIQVHGPFQSFSTDSPFITVGRAIYDKITQEFISCMAIDFTLHSLEQIVHESRITENAQVSIVRYDALGTVVGSTAWNLTNETMTLDQLDAGVSETFYQSFLSLVNYSLYDAENWSAMEIREEYEEAVTVDNGYLVSGYPIPPPPETYDPNYSPEFIAFVAIPVAEAYQETNYVQEEVDEVVHQLIITSVIVGLAGLGVIIIAIIFVSNYLTSPLRYMNDVASHIINNKFGGQEDDKKTWEQQDNNETKDGKKTVDGGVDAKETVTTTEVEDIDNHHAANNYKSYTPSKCAPKTEVNEVAEQFGKMVSNFTAGSVAKSVKFEVKEFRNKFKMKQQFKELYLSRHEIPVEGGGETKDRGKKFKYDFNKENISAHSLETLHFGRSLRKKDESTRKSTVLDSIGDKKVLEKRRGSLFIWIVVLTVIPFLITTAGLAGYVGFIGFSEFHKINDETKSNFVEYQINVLQIYANHRAALASVFMERPVRDLHVVTRYAGWLLLNGVRRAQSFTDMVSNVEACKFSPNMSICEDFVESYTCDCFWDDKRGTCQNYDIIDSRYLQKPFIISQSQDAHPNTGVRNSTSYPNVSYTPETTEWYDNITSLPGSNEGFLASGFNTTYARVRSLSALPVLQAVYNQDIGKNKKVHLGSFFGFEADGTFIGYEGCAYPGHSNKAQFLSTSANAEIRPNICPEGKYGYDPRCRAWYANGKALHLAGTSDLHVTPPYRFAAMDFFGQTATSPMTSPITGEYIGQAEVDFIMQPLLESLNNRQTSVGEGGFSILITASSDSSENDTIVGPGFDFDNPKPIADVVFAKDPNCYNNSTQQQRQICGNHRRAFQHIVEAMKAGNQSYAQFQRTFADGSSAEEGFYMAYAPVVVNSVSAVDSSDFSRGVKASQYIIYSVAIVETVAGVVGPLDLLEDTIASYVIIAITIMVFVIVVTSFSVIYISYRMALSITEPMLYLLELIGYINSLESYNDSLQIDVNRRGHSLEVVNVSKTLESLYHVIRSANLAFFDGNLEQAYSDLTDVLRVYRMLENRKGMSIACNNLGNVMRAVYRMMEANGEQRFRNFTKRQIISMGINYFHESIQLGEKAYDVFYETQGWSPSCLEFMQHLSNRYFNRAMFLLAVKEGHEQPSKIEELGFRDLQIAQDMDLEIVEEGTQAGWGVRKSDKLFSVTLSRVRGLLFLLDMGYEDDYDLEDRLEELYKTLTVELKKYQQNAGDSALFEDLTPAGRMQQVETEIMRYKMLKGDIETAAKIAIRMLVEDEYIILNAQQKAVEVLVNYVASSEYKGPLSSDSQKRLEIELHEYRSRLEQSCEDLQRSTSFSTIKPTANESVWSNRNMFESGHLESQRGDTTMEAF